MNQEVTELTINGVTYIKKGTENQPAEKLDGLEYVIIRGDRSGAFAGYLESLNETGKIAVMKNCRRLWYWDGAASLSGMAADGVSKPKNCKFTAPVKIKITDVIEVISVSAKAQKSIEAVEVWKS